MQKLSKTEVEWLLIAIESYMKALEESMSQESNGIFIALYNLRREHMLIIRSKLKTALAEKNKRIEITY